MTKKFQGSLFSPGADLPSALVVFLVALPLCLGIALGSNAPLFSGLIAGIIGGIIVGLLSGSHVSVSGPAAGLTAVVVVGIARLEVFDVFLLSVVIAGLMQIVLGFVRAGILGDYIPSCVIKGMLAAIGIILILKQLPHLVGYDANFEGDESFLQRDGENTFSEIAKAFNYIIPAAAIIGVLSILLQIFWDKVLAKKHRAFKVVPAPLLVVLLSVAINEMLRAYYPAFAIRNSHLVSIPVAASFGEFVSFFTIPDFSQILNPVVWTTALTIAIVASLETMLNIEAADKLDTYQRVTPKNRELGAQGIGNTISGLIGGLPITSVIVRTSANVHSGAKTKASTIIHGLLILISVSLAPAILNLIPLSALAGILIYTGYKLANAGIFKELYSKGLNQFIPFVVTIIAILLTDLLVGIFIGCITGLFFVMRSNFRSAVFVVRDGDRYLFRLKKDVSFLNKPIIKTRLEQVPANSQVFIDASKADFIDRDVVEVIENYMVHAPLKNITVELKRSGVKTQGFSNAREISTLQVKQEEHEVV